MIFSIYNSIHFKFNSFFFFFFQLLSYVYLFEWTKRNPFSIFIIYIYINITMHSTLSLYTYNERNEHNTIIIIIKLINIWFQNEWNLSYYFTDLAFICLLLLILTQLQQKQQQQKRRLLSIRNKINLNGGNINLIIMEC